jgi:flagellar biosynthesis chaperone FliJ
MQSHLCKISALFLAGFILFNAGLFSATAATNLSGRILLQVQDKGQAWYVNPVNYQRYYLGRPDDAFNVMRSLGLGVSNADFNVFWKSAPRRLAGRILLQVEDKGQAYYLDPVDLKFYYLGRPADAFNVMRSRGLGITNTDLAKIPVAGSSGSAAGQTLTPSAAITTERTFSFKYQNSSYEITQGLSEDWYNVYRNLPKSYSYLGDFEPENLRELFYGLFLAVKPGDNSLDELIGKLRVVAASRNWGDDELAEFTMALVQYIPYDRAKLADSDRNNNPYYPYETLYLNRGVCSDKTFLALTLLRRLGYGAAILDFPDLNHTAAGIACTNQYSLAGSGYCYIETTNYFPLGVIPRMISSGQAENSQLGLVGLFDESGLGRIETYQKTSGRLYYRISETRQKVAELNNLKLELTNRETEIDSLADDLQAQENAINSLKSQLDAYYNNGQLSQYNNLVPTYNSAISQYNSDLAAYQVKITEYNALIASYNQAQHDFYQQ